MLNQTIVENIIEKKFLSAEKFSLEKGSKTLLSQVVGIIIGSPEFQRK